MAIWMASFLLKTHFPTPMGSFNPKFENVSLALHPRNFVHREHWHRTNYPGKKFFSMIQRLSATSVKFRQTDGRTDDRRQWHHRCLHLCRSKYNYKMHNVGCKHVKNCVQYRPNDQC